MSAVTRSRSSAGSIAMLKSCGPSSEMTDMWTRFLSSAKGSCSRAGRLSLEIRSWSSMTCLPSEEPARASAASSRPLATRAAASTEADASPMTRSARRPNASAGSDWGRATTIGMPSLTVRGISRSEG